MRHGWVLIVLLALGLAACGSGPRVRVFPPELSIAETRYDDASGSIQLRMRSFSTVPVRVDRISGHVAFGTGALRVPITLSPNLQIAATSVELLEVRFNDHPELLELLRTATAERRAVSYRIEALVETSEPRSRFEVEYRSSLAPAPGLPGVLR